ncbi:MAG: hydroxymethylpyrimidine/phosphomethylpyrimidine kinase [Gammaproteobacteria bacterium]|nr:MAG: hydroxymethylpyrimidine/phosphomethylpyrimidine kinase [Gammaproteobacteria bacterium]
MARQLSVLQEDFSIDAVKIGMLGSHEVLNVVVDFLIDVCPAHVVLDPVWRSSSGHELADDLLIRGIREQLLPLVEVATPNHDEARSLVGADFLQWEAWTGSGVKQVLITGGDEATERVEMFLLSPRSRQVFYSERLTGAFHGTGCTLSSALAMQLASGRPMQHAVRNAREYVHHALVHAHYPGRGMAFPGRNKKDEKNLETMSSGTGRKNKKHL